MTIETIISVLKEYLAKLNDEQKIEALNKIKISLHQISPFKNEPTDCVLWIKQQQVIANDYNPNVMSPTEKEITRNVSGKRRLYSACCCLTYSTIQK